MKYYYLQRWLASKAKLEGKTIRQSPSEHTWELVITNGHITWFRLSGDALKEPVFGNEISVDQDQAKKFLRELKINETKSIKPGEFLNDTKNTIVFVRLAQKGRGTLLEDDVVKRYILKGKQIVFTPRKGVKDQYRVSISGGPGDEMIDQFAAKNEPKLQIIEDKNNPDVVILKNVPIAKAGVWNGIQITGKILEGLKTRFEKLKEKLFVPLKLEHSGVSESEEQSPQGPALGWLTKIFLVGDALYGDFVKVPKAVARLIKNGQYIGVSPEIARNFEGTPDVLVGVALLGAALPAMTTLPKLLTLYAEKEGVETYKPSIPFSAFGGEMSEEKVVNQTDGTSPEVSTATGTSPEATTGTQSIPVAPQVDNFEKKPHVDSFVDMLSKLVFQRKSGEGDQSELINALMLKRYPRVLAEEMLELLPDATLEKIDVIPEYDLTMLEQRIDVLSDRSKQPEKCEKVIEEIEEALEIFKDDLASQENAKIKKSLEDVLAEAKKNKGTTELEEAIAKETPAEETYPKAEQYPSVPENVQIDLQKMEAELKRRALGLVKATVEKFQLSGWDQMQCQKLEEMLIQLDPALTPTPNSGHVRTLLFQLLDSAPRRVDTFQQAVTPDAYTQDLVETILSSTKRARAKH